MAGRTVRFGKKKQTHKKINVLGNGALGSNPQIAPKSKCHLFGSA